MLYLPFFFKFIKQCRNILNSQRDRKNVKAGSNCVPCCLKIPVICCSLSSLISFVCIVSFQIAKFEAETCMPSAFLQSYQCWSCPLTSFFTEGNKFLMLCQGAKLEERNDVTLPLSGYTSSTKQKHESCWWAFCTNCSQLKRGRVCWCSFPLGDHGQRADCQLRSLLQKVLPSPGWNCPSNRVHHLSLMKLNNVYMDEIYNSSLFL